MRHHLAPLILCFTLLSSQALGWQDGGHRIIASIAYRRLSPEKRAAVVEILRHHPRFQEDFSDKIPGDVDEESRGEWLLQQAAVWPDMARSFKGEMSQYHHSSWHYVNVPLFLDPADRTLTHDAVSFETPASLDSKSNVIQTIRVARRTVMDAKADPAERAVMLCWLLHCGGDVHQPLHTVSLFSRRLYPKGDRGGNSVATVQRGNLHTLWDSFPGGKLKFLSVRARAVALQQELASLGEAAALELNEERWVDESREALVNCVYDAEVMAALRAMEESGELQPIRLSEEYLSAGGATAQRRVVQAGYRLGEILRTIPE